MKTGQAGEWTLETIALLQSHGGIDAIVAAHNAALAAERGRCERGLCKGAALFAGKEAETIEQLQAQLAAEQEIAAVTWAKGHDAGYREGVAAEREKVAAAWRKGFDDGFKKGKECR